MTRDELFDGSHEYRLILFLNSETDTSHLVLYPTAAWAQEGCTASVNVSVPTRR
jgi:hypothetical protein